MKTHSFLVKCQTTVLLSGIRNRFSAGDLIPLTNEVDIEAIINKRIEGSEHLVLISVADDADAEAIQAHVESVVAEHIVEETLVQIDEPIQLLETSSSQFVDEVSINPEASLSSLPEVPLEEDSHWSTVKAFLNDLEDIKPIDFPMVHAVKLRFGHFKAVRQEANRILELEPS